MFSFAFFLPLQHAMYARPLSPYLSPSSPIPSRHRHRSQPNDSLSHTPIVLVSQWQQTLLPPDPSLPPLSTFFDNFPRHYSQLFLLGLNPDQDTVFLTSHEKLTDHRPPYAISSDTLPLPLPTPTRSASALIRDLFGYNYATPCEQDKSFMSGNASLVTKLLPISLCRYLEINNILANDIVRTLSKSKNIASNRIANILDILRICDARIAGAAILDSATSSPTSANTIILSGVLYIEKRIATMYGEIVFSEPVPISVDAHFAVATAIASEVPCFIRNDIFDTTSVRVYDMAQVYASYGYRPVIIDDRISSSTLPSQDVETDKPSSQSTSVGDPLQLWQLTVDDVLSLSDEEIRTALRSESVALRNDESRQSMLGKLVQFMDEVHRRELGIILAAQEEMFDMAAILQKGRSKRGKLLAELRQAEKLGNWSQVIKLAAEMKTLEQKTQDITAEPGSYNPDLDQDEWYKPCR